MVQEVSDDEDDHRGRSRVKRRCLATEEDMENEDDVHGTKRQRLQSSRGTRVGHARSHRAARTPAVLRLNRAAPCRDPFLSLKRRR